MQPACNSCRHYPLCGREGHSLLGEWAQEAREHYGPTLETARRTGWMPAPTEMVSIRDPELTQWVLHRVRPHPFGTYTEAFSHRGSRRHEVPHSYLRCGTLDGEEHPRHRATEPSQLAVP